MRYFLFLSLLFPSLLWSNTRGITQVDLQIPQGECISLYKESYALVIGTSDYQDLAWGDLISVPQDVTAVKEALEQQEFQVQTVMDPSSEELDDKFEEFIDNYGYDKDNRLLFYCTA
jgi:hypothetical protein